ncbi:hypothetical protein V6Z12_A06G006700 [Gossypium hirsutum]
MCRRNGGTKGFQILSTPIPRPFRFAATAGGRRRAKGAPDPHVEAPLKVRALEKEIEEKTRSLAPSQARIRRRQKTNRRPV